MQMGFYCWGERDLKLGVKTGLIKITHRVMSVRQNNGPSTWYDYKCLEG